MCKRWSARSAASRPMPVHSGISGKSSDTPGRPTAHTAPGSSATTSCGCEGSAARTSTVHGSGRAPRAPRCSATSPPTSWRELSSGWTSAIGRTQPAQRLRAVTRRLRQRRPSCCCRSRNRSRNRSRSRNHSRGQRSGSRGQTQRETQHRNPLRRRRRRRQRRGPGIRCRSSRSCTWRRCRTSFSSSSSRCEPKAISLSCPWLCAQLEVSNPALQPTSCCCCG